MQILTPEFLAPYPNQVINIHHIHHSFLSAFSGASPYAQAYARGVKIIGATSHYVTALVDDGPIIEQATIQVSHRDTLDDLLRKGRDLERIVLRRRGPSSRGGLSSAIIWNSRPGRWKRTEHPFG